MSLQAPPEAVPVGSCGPLQAEQALLRGGMQVKQCFENRSQVFCVLVRRFPGSTSTQITCNGFYEYTKYLQRTPMAHEIPMHPMGCSKSIGDPRGESITRGIRQKTILRFIGLHNLVVRKTTKLRNHRLAL